MNNLLDLPTIAERIAHVQQTHPGEMPDYAAALLAELRAARAVLRMVNIKRDPEMNAVWVQGEAAAAHEIERVLARVRDD
jgi:hypothetical protein